MHKYSIQMHNIAKQSKNNAMCTFETSYKFTSKLYDLERVNAENVYNAIPDEMPFDLARDLYFQFLLVKGYTKEAIDKELNALNALIDV